MTCPYFLQYKEKNLCSVYGKISSQKTDECQSNFSDCYLKAQKTQAEQKPKKEELKHYISPSYKNIERFFNF